MISMGGFDHPQTAWAGLGHRVEDLGTQRLRFRCTLETAGIGTQQGGCRPIYEPYGAPSRSPECLATLR